VLLQQLERNDLERTFVCAGEHDWSRNVAFQQFEPSSRANAPAVAGLQAGEIHIRSRCREVVPDKLAVAQKGFGDFDAHRVAAHVVGTGIAMPVPKKAGYRRIRTWP
jgi:hypothetical protein